MRELQRQADDRSKWETVVGLPSTVGLVGHPVHFIDGQWYVEISNSTVSRSWATEALQIFEVLEQGTWKYVADRNHIEIWDSGQWLVSPMELVHQLPDDLQEGQSISPAALAQLRALLAEWEEEEERLALRQALLEVQTEEDF